MHRVGVSWLRCWVGIFAFNMISKLREEGKMETLFEVQKCPFDREQRGGHIPGAFNRPIWEPVGCTVSVLQCSKAMDVADV